MAIHQRLNKTLWTNVLWLISGNGLRLVFSACYFLGLTRLLGPEQFGLFAAILACTNLMAPFAYLGQPQLLAQQLSREPQQTQWMWGRAWVISVGLGTGLSMLLCVPLQLWLPGTSWPAIGAFLFSELVIVGVQYVHKGVLIGRERIAMVSVIDTAMAMARLVTVGFAWGLGCHTLEYWSLLYLLMTVLIGVVTHFMMRSQIGPLDLKGMLYSPPSAWLGQAGAGWNFAISAMAVLAFMDLDKLLLPRLTSPLIAGEYSAAYRLITFAQVPIMALMTSSLAESCRQGWQGLKQGTRYGLRLVPWVLLYGAIAVGAVVLLSDQVPRILGQGYGQTAVILRWLSLLILLEGLHQLLANILTGADRLIGRSFVQVMGLLLNGLLNIIWIPLWGWQGAALATLVAEVALIAGLTGYLGWGLLREPT